MPDTIESGASPHRITTSKIFGGLATLVGIVGGILGIIQYWQTRPSYDLSGEWRLTNKIDATTYLPYKGLQLGYRLFITQTGTELKATGEKWSENGAEVPSPQHTPIEVAGSINGSHVTATFIEHGTRRETSGTFEWTVGIDGGTMSGRFSSTAADSTGSSKLDRVAR